ncbi:hypothetical protein IRP63_15990 (plasmid) [Clostridium botulinum]|uniref:Major sperm protein n=1 Tax=Clostridium botulinum C/D str. DC5 TaxID=1443128 RepID=A0A0A0HXV2_CLOBO|nr:hypothetical protein [Clostridium botulinum]KGM92906.1 hypothetical protein Z955_16515 [Clostridium botulinum C/D str. DC5]KOC46322.1 hypothetical protein ADU88_12170 [Clostridium botulinum]KOC52063.1 hypothetical protein ADU89_12465 [Clostridium botulinum]KOC54639.1 hypothetical protein ADU90_12345 [Clostridium botulinum]MCD3235398.1 hypothetical protein [Clostridium botulinum D/C]
MFNYCCQYCAQYCKNFFGTVGGGTYIEIINKTHLPIYFIVQYTLDVRTFTKKTSVFGYGKSGKIQFSQGSKNVCFNVLDNSTTPPKLITNVTLPVTKRSCYNLMPTSGRPQLVEFSC